MSFRPILVLTAAALLAAGCFQQKAPPRPVKADSLETPDPAAVQYLDLHDRKGLAFPASMSAFSSLAILNLRNTGLGEPPAALGTIPGLVELDLSENSLTVLPDPQLLPKLQRLYLSDNQLAGLPPTVARFSSLTYLNLDRNRITALPDEIGQLAELRFLRLSGNKLETLPETIGQLKKLKRLYLRGNPLTDEAKEKIRAALPETEIIL